MIQNPSNNFVTSIRNAYLSITFMSINYIRHNLLMPEGEIYADFVQLDSTIKIDTQIVFDLIKQ